MFIETKVFKVETGTGEELIERFSKRGIIVEQPGFIELMVMKKVRRADYDEITLMIRWESQEDYTNWKRSDAHQSGHKQKKERPSHILDVTMETYRVESVITK